MSAGTEALLRAALDNLLEHAKPGDMVGVSDNEATAWQFAELVLEHVTGDCSAEIVVAIDFEQLRSIVAELRRADA